MLLRLQGDEKMDEIMSLAHTFLQYFCRDNPQNQALLHKHLNLFLTPGVRFTTELISAEDTVNEHYTSLLLIIDYLVLKGNSDDFSFDSLFASLSF